MPAGGTPALQRAGHSGGQMAGCPACWREVSPEGPGPVRSCWVRPCERGGALAYSDRHPLVPAVLTVPQCHHHTALLLKMHKQCLVMAENLEIQIKNNPLLSCYPAMLMAKVTVMVMMGIMEKSRQW